MFHRNCFCFSFDNLSFSKNYANFNSQALLSNNENLKLKMVSKFIEESNYTDSVILFNYRNISFSFILIFLLKNNYSSFYFSNYHFNVSWQLYDRL